MKNIDYIFPHAINSINFNYSLIGFGSTIIHMLGTFEYCKKYDIDFNFDSYGITKLYNDSNISVFDTVFDDGSLKISFNNNRRYDCLNNLPYSIPFFNYLDCCDDKTFFISKKWANIFNNIIKENLFLKKEFVDYINYYSKNLDGDYYGIHLRGTDMEAHGKLKPIEQKIIQIEEAFEKSNCKKIFIMTDEENLLELCKNVFKDKVFYYDFITRSKTNQPLHHHRNTKNGQKIFVDLILEMYSIKKCNNLFLSRSGVSAFISSLNPDSNVTLFNDDLSKHDLNTWKNKLFNNFNFQYLDRKPTYDTP